MHLVREREIKWEKRGREKEKKTKNEKKYFPLIKRGLVILLYLLCSRSLVK